VLGDGGAADRAENLRSYCEAGGAGLADDGAGKASVYTTVPACHL
jgi:hypothetical protein